MNAIESFIEGGFSDAMSYEKFRQLIDELLSQNKVTGSSQPEDYIPYTKQNIQRMNRLDKHYNVNSNIQQRLQHLKRSYTFLTITEGWCGDSSQIAPVIEKMAAASDNIDSLYILRDEHLDIMDLFLTNGTRSIPITLCIDNELKKVLWQYGSRPLEAMKLVKQAKAEGATKEQVSEQLHLWYARNKQQAIENELTELLSTLS